MNKLIKDVGKIVRVSYTTEYGLNLQVETPSYRYSVSTKVVAVLSNGKCTLSVYKKGKEEHYEGRIECVDPRMLFMYLYPFWRLKNGKEIKVPIPTKKEAIKWLQEADVQVGRNMNDGYNSNGGLTEKQRKFFNL